MKLIREERNYEAGYVIYEGEIILIKELEELLKNKILTPRGYEIRKPNSEYVPVVYNHPSGEQMYEHKPKCFVEINPKGELYYLSFPSFKNVYTFSLNLKNYAVKAFVKLENLKLRVPQYSKKSSLGTPVNKYSDRLMLGVYPMNRSSAIESLYDTSVNL